MQTSAVVYVFYIHIKTTVGSEKLTKEKMKLNIVYTVSKRCCLAHITVLVQIIHTWNITEREHHIVFILIEFFSKLLSNYFMIIGQHWCNISNQKWASHFNIYRHKTDEKCHEMEVNG